MKNIIYIPLLISFWLFNSSFILKNNSTNIGFTTSTSLYELSFESIDGNTISLSEFKGKNILIVNTASRCGYTKQYNDLQKLQESYPS
ncbi:MAG: glutathione peroxidase, partial [Flavobacteriales bacterium]